MIVIGIDPGLTKANPLGIAMFDVNNETLVSTRSVDFKMRDGDNSIDSRLAYLADGLLSALVWPIAVYGAENVVIAYEYPHHSKNQQTTIKLALACGVVIGAAVVNDIRCFSVQPTEAKQALTGDSRADKAAMMTMVSRIYGKHVSKDEADAVGIALAGAGKLKEHLITEMVKEAV